MWKTCIKGLPRGMISAAFPDDHSHDGVFVSFPTSFMELYGVVDIDAADKVAGDENKVRSDDSMGIDVA